MTTESPSPKPRKRRPAAGARWVAAGLSATATLGIVAGLAATEVPQVEDVAVRNALDQRPVIIRRIIRRHVARPTVYRRVYRSVPRYSSSPSAPATVTRGS